ncbi:MAG: transposase [Candidatus Competibacter sp.]|nr:transposase [Candidatus Competibacter sp.]
MPLEEFIITVFCWVETAFEDVTAGIKLRTRGFASRSSDSEVITMEIVGEVLGYDGDEAIWEYYYGLKAHLLIDLRGVAVGVTVTAANVDERDAAYDVLSAIEGLVLGDKGYIRPRFKADGEALGIDLQTPVRRNMKEPRPRWWLLQRVRKRIETVISQLEQRFNPAKTRARDVWHLTNQVTRKLLAHTMGVWLNLRLGREPLDLDGLLAA